MVLVAYGLLFSVICDIMWFVKISYLQNGIEIKIINSPSVYD